MGVEKWGSGVFLIPHPLSPIPYPLSPIPYPLSN